MTAEYPETAYGARCEVCDTTHSAADRFCPGCGTAVDDAGPDETLDRVMVDIETLGLDVGAAIVSIGAVRFGVDGLGETFEASISLSSCQQYGLDIDADTLEWWLDQKDVAREQLTGGDDLADVLVEFAEWFGNADEVWANSPSFDCEQLEVAFDAVDVDAPWAYYEERDYRTLTALPVAVEMDQDGTEHDALDDAKHQARVAVATLRRMGGFEPVAAGEVDDVE